MHSGRCTLLALATLVAIPACHHGGVESRPTPEEEAARRPFIGWIREIRANMIVVDEEGNMRRRAEILVMPATEITARSGALVPVANLRPRLRVTVWFRGSTGEAAGILTASADRMIVDY